MWRARAATPKVENERTCPSCWLTSRRRLTSAASSQRQAAYSARCHLAERGRARARLWWVRPNSVAARRIATGARERKRDAGAGWLSWAGALEGGANRRAATRLSATMACRFDLNRPLIYGPRRVTLARKLVWSRADCCCRSPPSCSVKVSLSLASARLGRRCVSRSLAGAAQCSHLVVIMIAHQHHATAATAPTERLPVSNLVQGRPGWGLAA